MMTDETVQVLPENSPVMQQIGMLNLRLGDMMTQLNTVMKMVLEENATLKKENADLKNKKTNDLKT